MASVGERPGRPFSGMVAGRPKSEAAPTPSRKRLRASSNSTMPFISCKARRTASARLRPRRDETRGHLNLNALSRRSCQMTPSRKRLRASSKSTMPTISRKKRRTVKEDTSVCMAETVNLVGDAAEDVELHFLRHPQKDIEAWAKKCSRCAFVLRRRRGHQQRIWLAEKPRFMSGPWGWGCAWCAAGRESPHVEELRTAARLHDKNRGCKQQAVSRASSFARYDIRGGISSKTASALILNHESSSFHKICQSAFSSPSAQLRQSYSNASSAPLAQLPPAPSDQSSPPAPSEHRLPSAPVQEQLARPANPVGSLKDDPFRGCVPQVEDWLRIWADCTECLSLRKTGRLAKKAMQGVAISRQRSRKMLAILAEVIP